MWKKIVDSTDTISYEKKGKINARIEARLENNRWKVFVHYFSTTGIDHFDEYNAEKKEDASAIIKGIMRKKISVSEIEKIKLERKKKLSIDVKRCYHEYNIEKWEFRIRPDSEKNLLFIRSDEITEIDVVMHAKYKQHEEKIVDELKGIFSFGEFETEISIFYYNECSKSKIKPARSRIITGKIEFGYDLISGNAGLDEPENN
jgi:hypothetical protein